MNPYPSTLNPVGFFLARDPSSPLLQLFEQDIERGNLREEPA